MRNLFLDRLKGIAILFVVLGHILQYACCMPTDSFMFSCIYAFHMPLFMFLCGYSLSLNHETLEIQYVVSRIVSLLVPYFCWGGVFLFFQFIQNHNVMSVFHCFSFLILYPVNGLWFLWCLAWITFLSFFAQWISKKLGCDYLGYVFVVGTSTIIYLVTKAHIFSFDLISWHIVFFFCGYLLKQIWLNRPNSFKMCIEFFAIVLFPAFICFWRFPNTFLLEPQIKSIITEPAIPFFLSKYIVFLLFLGKKYFIQILGIIFVISLCKILKKLDKGVIQRILQYIGQHSLAIYAIHFFIVKSEIVIINSFLTYVIKFIFALIIPLILERLLNLNSITSFLFLGKKINKRLIF